MTKLIEWKNSPYRKPLILWGARQVGKTWLLKEFGRREFGNTVYISFYNNSRIASVFEEDYSPERIIHALKIRLHTEITAGETLIIFDEVQHAPKVIESLKYFCEEAPEYHIAAAGSLLGVAIHEGVSFPVGKVDELRIYPLDFCEYLRARDEQALCEYITEYNETQLESFQDRYKELLREYMIVGGMPEVVERFRSKQDFSEARELQLDIVRQYENDFGKHTPLTVLPRIRMVWNAIPTQLAKENRKFFFGQVKQGARMKDFELAIQWLYDAGLIYKVNKVSKPAMPLKAYADNSAFKLYMIDVGLLGAAAELDPYSVYEGNDIFVEFKGALTEQYVLQQIISSTSYTPYYYAGEKSTYETDFLIQKGRDVIPLEVKAEENLKSKSLRVYYDKFAPAFTIRTSMAGAKDRGWVKNIPLWAISQC